MPEPVSGLKKARYYGSVSMFYALTLLLAFVIFRPFNVDLLGQKPVAAAITPVVASEPIAKPVISGPPVRIVIAELGIDLPVDEGFYNAADGSWTLSGYHAQFAMLSKLANDTSGDTFIYGHDNPYVFEHLSKITAGAQVLVYTDNNHVFSYIFQNTHATTPDDTSVLSYQGPPIMTVQTCSGAWFEQRQMYEFKFDKVLQ